MTAQITPQPLTADQDGELQKAARIFTNTLLKVARDNAPGASAPDRLQWMTTVGVQAVTTGVGRAFDDAASTGLDAELFEALVAGLGTACGLKFGAIDALTREFVLRAFLSAMHGAIQFASGTAPAPAPSGEPG